MIGVCLADYRKAEHRCAVRELIDLYARDEMGLGRPLERAVYDRLVENLASRRWVRVYLATYAQHIEGLAVCVEGFSTFNGAPLMNIHDIFVRREFRRRGIAHKLLEVIEAQSREMGFCKLTLEVLEDNQTAKNSYQKFGFVPYSINNKGGIAQFWHKILR